MPFKSEAQRRYLWANEPEIARDWTDEYGSRIQRDNGGIMQGGVQNFLGQQPTVNAPKYWQSAPDHEITELAYITPRERDVLVDMDMYGTMSGGPNRGPSGLMSLNGWGSRDPSQNRPGADISAAMDRSGSDPGWSPSSGGGGSSAVAAQTISPAQLQLMHEQKGGSTVLPESTFGRTYQQPRRGIGNFFSGLGRGIGNLAMMFNPFTAAAGIMGNPKTAAFLNLMSRGKNKLGTGRSEFGQYNNLADYLNRNKRPRVDDEIRLAMMQDPDLQADIMKDFRRRNPLDLTPDYMHDLEAKAPEGITNYDFDEVDESINPNIDPMTFASIKDMNARQIVEFNKLDLLDKMNQSGVGERELTPEEKQKLEFLRRLRQSGMTSSTGTAIV